MIRIAGFLFLLAAVSFVEVAIADPWPEMRAYDRAVRQLDGEEFLEDEPIWLCLADLSAPPGGWTTIWHDYRVIGTDAGGHPVERIFPKGLPMERGGAVPRVIEFGSSFDFAPANGRFPLLGARGAIPAGVWQVRYAEGDTARVLARFRVVSPAGSERSVRDGLARAKRIAHGDPARAARLYEAIYRRYPRTTYLNMIYLGQWEVRSQSRFAHDPDRWLEEVFAHFHDSCFGTIALDQWVHDVGAEKAKPTIHRLVGLYPDTPLSRAAARYL